MYHELLECAACSEAGRGGKRAEATTGAGTAAAGAAGGGVVGVAGPPGPLPPVSERRVSKGVDIGAAEGVVVVDAGAETILKVRFGYKEKRKKAGMRQVQREVIYPLPSIVRIAIAKLYCECLARILDN